MISSRVAVLTWGIPIGKYSVFSFASIVIASSFLLSPRTISFTTPLTGEQSLMWGRFLSARTGVPALTSSPSLTSILGLNALKSVGFTATIPGDIVLVILG
ncbi:hypothetical protein SDC9_75594 [bioreactor metagenome]|uniref:Uncharacterized protein n=1 Tax=bioreactor metagenome TaxID=1076179 RepID=A0A644YKF5_9ZZZZ